RHPTGSRAARRHRPRNPCTSRFENPTLLRIHVVPEGYVRVHPGPEEILAAARAHPAGHLRWTARRPEGLGGRAADLHVVLIAMRPATLSSGSCVRIANA